MSPKTGREVKVQCAFGLPDNPVTFLGGIYEDGHFSIMTCEPNPLGARRARPACPACCARPSWALGWACATPTCSTVATWNWPAAWRDRTRRVPYARSPRAANTAAITFSNSSTFEVVYGMFDMTLTR